MWRIHNQFEREQNLQNFVYIKINNMHLENKIEI